MPALALRSVQVVLCVDEMTRGDCSCKTIEDPCKSSANAVIPTNREQMLMRPDQSVEKLLNYSEQAVCNTQE